MNLVPDIGPDDLKVFLDEADEQLQMLDANIVALENADDQEDLIQEIFRAAHTLKGSSAMLGYQEMTDLGHAMETPLDKVRKGTLEPTTQVVDALLHSLDVLQLLKDALVDESMDVVDVSESPGQRDLPHIAIPLIISVFRPSEAWARPSPASVVGIRVSCEAG